MMSLQTISNAIGSTLRGSDVQLTGVTTDSRGDCTGQLFVALKGLRFDAHDYLEQAQHNGAVAVMLERKVETELPVLLVKNSLAFLMLGVS